MARPKNKFDLHAAQNFLLRTMHETEDGHGLNCQPKYSTANFSIVKRLWAFPSCSSSSMVLFNDAGK